MQTINYSVSLLWIILTVTILPLFAQEERQVLINPPSLEEIPQPFEENCQQLYLGYGFENSGMSQYLLQNQILETRWKGDTLNIKARIITDCCGYDYLNYKVEADAITLVHGFEENIWENREEGEIITCMCESQGCFFEMEFKILGAKRGKNYLIKHTKAAVLGLVEPEPIEFMYPQQASVYYKNCKDVGSCFEDKLQQGIEHYKALIPLYESYIAFQGSIANKEIGNEIRRNWVGFVKTISALKSRYVASRLDKIFYEQKWEYFNTDIKEHRLMLEPLMQVASLGNPVPDVVFEEINEKEINLEDVYEIVENTAQPKDGFEAFYQYIKNNLTYPERAKIIGLEGKVYVGFVIRKNGKITDIKVERTLGFGCDEEAIRLIGNSGNWLPAQNNGKKVNQKIILPVHFKLDEKKGLQ